MFGAFQESRPAYGDERNLVLYLNAAPLNSSNVDVKQRSVWFVFTVGL